jgi:hypothetical protein
MQGRLTRLTGLVALGLAGCGYVGDPLPPSLKIPRPVADLSVLQRGDKILIEFTLPVLSTDGVGLDRLGEIDLRIGAEGVAPWQRETWEARASAIPVPSGAPGERLRAETPASAWAGREVIVAVRVAGPSGRLSDWSDFRALHVVRPLPPPTDLAAQNRPEGVRLSWRWPDQRPARFRLLRRQGPQQAVALLAETDRLEWTDAGVDYGVRYLYQVQALVRTGDDVAESEASPPVAITPEDRFPPPAPSGLTAVAAPESVELSWERPSEEPGLTYRLWRAVEGGPLEPIAEGLTSPGYSDRTVTGGKRYTYAVSAADRLGNESEKSPPVEVVLP